METSILVTDLAQQFSLCIVDPSQRRQPSRTPLRGSSCGSIRAKNRICVRQLTNVSLDQRNYPHEASAQEAHMRRILIILAVAGIFACVMASPSKTTAVMDTTETHVIVEGLYVALPSDMKTFAVELVPLP
jgi:hypothetical protein